MEDHLQLVYRSEARRLGFVHMSSVKKNPTPSIMTVRRQSRKVMKFSPSDKNVRARMEVLAKLEYPNDETQAGSGALQLEAESALQVS